MEPITYEMALMILDQIDSVSFTDKEGRYIYQNKNWISRRLSANQDINTIHAWDIIKDSKVAQVIKTRQPYRGHITSVGDNIACCNYYPVIKDEEFIGVLIWTFFTSMDLAVNFSRNISELAKELEEAKAQISRLSRATYSISNIIGESPAIIKLKEEITAAARTRSTVLIEGETGVGKELVAHAIHEMSSRNKARFVRVNCAAIPPELMESEFFGYEEGSFTGARKGGKAGKFELASSGSLFLDEINQLPLTMQPKFLRVLQEREVERIGGKNPVPVNARIISATNTSLAQMIKEGKFRKDLYYRLNVISLRIPPLRERIEDIPLLTCNILTKLNYQMGLNISDVGPDVLEMFSHYDWPGNIRELQNVLENAMNRATDETLEMKHFESFARNLFGDAVQERNSVEKPSLRDTRSKAEHLAIVEALKKCDGNKVSAAKLLNIARSSFYKKLQKYNL